MKHLLSIIGGKLFLMTIACIAFSCGNSDLPETTVKEFLNSIDSFEYDKAAVCITDGYKESLDNIKKASAGWNEQQKQEYKSKPKGYEFTLKEKTDSTANVFVGADTDGGEPVRMLFFLKKKNGQWLIDRSEDL